MQFGSRLNGWLAIRKLLEGGADATLVDEEGHTALWWAEKLGREGEVKELRRKKGG